MIRDVIFLKFRIIYAILAVAVAVAALCGALTLTSVAQNGSPVAIGVEGISGTVEAFCSALEEGDYASLEKLVYGYSSLGLTNEPSSDSAQILLRCLRDSYSCIAVGDGQMEGMTARQTVRVDYFSVALAEENVRKRAQELYDERLEDAQVNEDLYDENGDLKESIALDIYEKTLKEIAANPEEFIVSEEITLELVYSEGCWRIVLNDRLVDVLLGGINKL